MSSIRIPREFVDTMRTVTQIFPDLAGELRSADNPQKPNLERLNVWYIALRRYRGSTIIQATRRLAASPNAKRRPHPSEIVGYCRDAMREAETPHTPNYEAEKAAHRRELDDLRFRCSELTDDEIRQHLLMAAALNPLMRVACAVARGDARPVAEAHTLALSFVKDRLEAGLKHDDMAGPLYGGAATSVTIERIAGITEDMVREAREYERGMGIGSGDGLGVAAFRKALLT